MMFVLAALTLLFSQALSQNCPSGFIGYGGSCYFFVSNRLGFFQADQYCTSLHGVDYKYAAHLVSIESSGEQSFIKNTVKSNREMRDKDLWMGATQVDSSRGWVWTRTNQRFTYANWDGSPGSDYCGYMNEYESYKWKDSNCDNRKAFVCELTPRRVYEMKENKDEEVETQATCAAGFKSFNRHCYYFVPSSLNWYDADKFCTFLYPGTNYNVHLASVETSSEHTFLVNTVQNNGRYNSRNYWISGNKMERGRNWHWAGSDKDFTYSVWAPGQPDKSGQCTMMYKDRAYAWDDYTCTDKNAGFTAIGFICEYDPRKV